MTNSEKFCLKWNDFQQNITKSFGKLREDPDFSDVTLVCEDGQQLSVHKIILAASSPLFHNMFVQNKHGHPLVYMRGMKSEDLVSIIDFIYYGEASVNQEDLDKFLVLAEELKLKGLQQGSNNKQSEAQEQVHLETLDKRVTPKIEHMANEIWQEPSSISSGDLSQKHDMVLVLTDEKVSEDFQELHSKVKTMIIQGKTLRKDGKQRNSVCTVCGKEGQYNQIKDHIVANHVNISIPCNLCAKTFRSMGGLKWHNNNHHQ